jgi:Methyltransferase domain
MAMGRDIDRINDVCRGWSTPEHWAFFEQLFGRHPSLRDVCILGVYDGRDIAYMATILRRLERTGYGITGVDMFADGPLPDWPPGKIGLTWEQAGFGPAPVRERALDNLTRLGLHEGVTLVRSDAVAFLQSTDRLFDFIYIDTSHDYETTVAHIRASLPCMAPGGVIGGDDFSDKGTWGVRRAVRDCFSRFRDHKEMIWIADPLDRIPLAAGT